MSFKEKSIWISLIITVLIFGFYFVFTFTTIKNISPEEAAGTIAGIFIGVIILTIVMEIFLHSILAIAFRKEAKQGEDERDKLIELKGSHFSYIILAVGVWITGISLLFGSTPIMTANILLLFFIMAEIVGFAVQLYFYRRGI